MTIRIYSAVDAIDGKDSLFAIDTESNLCAVCTSLGLKDPWLMSDKFPEICSDPPERFKDAINPVFIREMEA